MGCLNKKQVEKLLLFSGYHCYKNHATTTTTITTTTTNKTIPLKLPSLYIAGSGQPFIWMHGMLNSVESDSIYSLIDFDHLSKQVSVVRYNYCDKSVTGNYSWESLTGELIGIADAKDLGPMILGGSSMGAAIAIHAAVKFPERVKALVLVTPPPAWEMRTDVKKTYQKIAGKTDSAKIPDFLKRLIAQNQEPPDFFVQMHPGTRKRLLEYRMDFEPEYYTKIYSGGAVSDLPPREQIAKIKVPTIIIALPDDPNHPIEIAQHLQTLISGSELVIVSSYRNFQDLQKKVLDFTEIVANNNKS